MAITTAVAGSIPDWTKLTNPEELARAKSLHASGSPVLINDTRYNLPSTAVPVVPPAGGNLQIPTPPPTGDDFSKRYEEWKKTQTNVPGFDFETEKTAAETAEANRKAAVRAAISTSAVRQRDEAKAIGAKTEAGYRTGLGMNQGLNWTSAGEDAVQGIALGTLAEIKNIDSLEQEALSKADSTSIENMQKTLSDLRDQRSKYSTDLLNTFNSIIENELATQQENRLAAGQKQTGENQKRDDARAVLQQILNNFAGADLSSLPQEIQTALGTIESEAGYPTGFVAQGLKSLKELKQTAGIEQDKTDALIKAMMGINKGVTINIPGLGNVEGQKNLPTVPTNPNGTLKEENQIVSGGKVIGLRRVYTNGKVELTDPSGNPMSMNLPADAQFYNIGTQPTKSTTGGLNGLRTSLGL